MCNNYNIPPKVIFQRRAVDFIRNGGTGRENLKSPAAVSVFAGVARALNSFSEENICKTVDSLALEKKLDPEEQNHVVKALIGISYGLEA